MNYRNRLFVIVLILVGIFFISCDSSGGSSSSNPFEGRWYSDVDPIYPSIIDFKGDTYIWYQPDGSTIFREGTFILVTDRPWIAIYLADGTFQTNLEYNEAMTELYWNALGGVTFRRTRNVP